MIRYQTAEACATRLTEMGHSLTDMIDEVNAASGALGRSSKQSATSTNGASGAGVDPLAQIVRILNAHLVQLQTIDAGAASLQGKVAAAQREAKNLTGETAGAGGLGGSRWVDDFGRSYLGRR